MGSADAPFAGLYDGNGHTIARLAVDRAAEDNIGLFGVVNGYDPQILDLHIVSGTVIGKANVGAICGSNHYGNIISCTNAASVTGTGDRVGGIAGLNDFGNIVASCNTGTVAGGGHVGGLAGNSSGGIIACYNSAAVTGTDDVGGVLGFNDTGIVNSCYNTQTVKGNSHVGGVVGFNSGPQAPDDPDMEDAGIVVACYNTGPVTGTTSVAGVAGLNAGMVVSCYWRSGTAAAGVNNSLDNPDLPGEATDMSSFTLPTGFVPDAATYSPWGIGNGTDGEANWKNYNGNGGLPQLWWEN